MATYEFKYRSELESESRMLRDLLFALDRHAVTGFVRHSFMVAVSEAFTNAITHGNGLDPKKQVIMAVHINKTEIGADIIDEGRGGLDRIKNKRPPSLLDEGGRGLGIIGHYADSVRLEQTEKGGLKISIRFTRARQKDRNTILHPHGGEHGN